MNDYYNNLNFVKGKVISYLEQIFKVYGNELILKLEDYNLLSNQNNCLETSTATGFILEEFITSKLEIFTKNHDGVKEIKVLKPSFSTNKLSYDCYIIYNNIYFMINIKIEKKKRANNAIAAINALYNDYVLTNPEYLKSYLVLKTYYDFGYSLKDKEKKIVIDKIAGYFLEEIDFSSNYKQDYRNWSKDFNANSGRLLISKKFYKNNLLPKEMISYKQTQKFLESIYNDEGVKA